LFDELFARDIFVGLLNDVDAAIAAEVWGGGAKYQHYSNIAMITLGTGLYGRGFFSIYLI
jgi:predicted NBD/HSP70 family sugar kinase